MKRGVIVYGPPASGKDTITTALTESDDRFRLFERLKAGSGRTFGYRMSTSTELDHLAESGEIVWENSRYSARYAIDRPHLTEMLHAGLIPVVHAGQPEVITALRDALPDTAWTVVQLRCSRDTAHRRIIERQTGDTDARLHAWDATPLLPDADLTVNTDDASPRHAASLIRSAADA